MAIAAHLPVRYRVVLYYRGHFHLLESSWQINVVLPTRRFIQLEVDALLVINFFAFHVMWSHELPNVTSGHEPSRHQYSIEEY